MGGSLTPRPHVVRTRASPNQNSNPSTECAKELEPKSPTGGLGHGVLAGINLFYLFKMTLNNKYSGSRIDEECSEMWYLVWIAESYGSLSFLTQFMPKAIRPRAHLPRWHTPLPPSLSQTPCRSRVTMHSQGQNLASCGHALVVSLKASP